MRVDQHKYLRIVLDSNLLFSTHIHAVITRSRKGIGMLNFLSKSLPRNTLSDFYKLYIRPHLDYGNAIYHVPEGDDGSKSYLMEKFESVQYSAALAVTGTWRGAYREISYNEFG